MQRHQLWLVLTLAAQLAPSALAAAPDPDRLAVMAARIETSCQGAERAMNRPHPQPSVRDLTAAALGWLELGQPAARAEKLIRHAFALQELDAASPAYGTVLWQEGHPEIKDANAIEFTMLPVGVIWRRHHERLDTDFLREAEPHLRAALTAIHRHNVPVKYSNIYLMKLANLLLLGEAVEDAAAVNEAHANFDTWLAFTRTNGLTEYDSPTYSPIQADCLALAHNLTRDAQLKARMKAALDLYWADMAANYVPARETMTGPASRDYKFLFTDVNVGYAYYLAGLRATAPADTFLCDAVRAWTAARMQGYWPAPDILALGKLPERVVRSRFGAVPGQDRYVWITPDFTLGSVSAYYGPQDKRICAELASPKPLPNVGLVVDDFDAPFGLVKTKDRSGHNKPHHLAHLIAAAQEKGFLLALTELSPGIQTGEFTNLASNLLLPVAVDHFVLDGQRVDGAEPFALLAGPNSVVGLREGKAALAARFFAADGCAAQPPTWELQYDGNAEGAARLVVHHYAGAAKRLAGSRIRCGLLLWAARCETEAEFQAFLQRAHEVKVTERVQDGIWQARAVTGAVELEAGLDLARKQVAWRRVNGRAWETKVLEVNGRDLLADLVGSSAAVR